MEPSNEPLLTPSQPVLIRVLGVDRDSIHGTVLERSGDRLLLRLRDSPAPQHLTLDAPVRIDAPETMLLGELASSRTGQDGTVLTIAIRHVLTHLSELTRMRNALLHEAGPKIDIGAGARASETDELVDRN